MEGWAEIRRLHGAGKVLIKEISRRLGVAGNTVRSVLGADRAPRYERRPKGSLVDAVEPPVRALLKEFPRMPATVIAERIGWAHSITILKDRVRAIRPEYAGVDPADRLVHEPGQATQCDLWFPEVKILVGYGQAGMLPVLVMTAAYSRFISAAMLPSRQAGDLLAGMWQLISAVGAVSKTLVWDRESAIGGTGKVSAPAAAFAGSLATQIRLLPRRDPESKGVVERHTGFFETSFLPGRTFSCSHGFNDQLTEWLPLANRRLVRASGARPAEAIEVDRAAMTPLPRVAAAVGLRAWVRLGRDYYVRIDGNDYSLDPRLIGRILDVQACPTQVGVVHDGLDVAVHPRCWARRVRVSDPEHGHIAAELRAGYRLQAAQAARRSGARHHEEGHPVMLRALPDYDALFGSDVDPAGGSDADAAGPVREGLS